jgi:CheY-like chemotaxis protein
MDFSHDSFLEEVDFDDVIQKPLTMGAFNVSLNKINDLNPHEPLDLDRPLKILLADNSSVAARVHSRVLSSLGHDVTVADPTAIIEDLVIDGDYTVLFIEARMLNGLSQKPVVRHLRDFEVEKKRSEEQAAVRETSQSKGQEQRMLDHMLDLIDRGETPFPTTRLVRNLSTKHALDVKLKAYQEAAQAHAGRDLDSISEVTFGDSSYSTGSSIGYSPLHETRVSHFTVVNNDPTRNGQLRTKSSSSFQLKQSGTLSSTGSRLGLSRGGRAMALSLSTPNLPHATSPLVAAPSEFSRTAAKIEKQIWREMPHTAGDLYSLRGGVSNRGQIRLFSSPSSALARSTFPAGNCRFDDETEDS